jgi:hypothetical protein
MTDTRELLSLNQNGASEVAQWLTYYDDKITDECVSLKAKEDMEQGDLDACRADTISLASAAFSLNETLCAVTHPTWDTHPCAGDRDGLAMDTLEFYNAASPSPDYSQTWSPWDMNVPFSGRAE